MSTDHAEDKYEGEVGPSRHRMPVDRGGLTCKVEITSQLDGQTQEGYITANTNGDGELREIFLHGFGKEGSTLEGWTQVAAILFSIALQYDAEFPMLARKLAHMRFEPCGPTNDPNIPYCASVPDYIMRWLVHHFGSDKLKADMAQISKEMSYFA